MPRLRQAGQRQKTSSKSQKSKACLRQGFGKQVKSKKLRNQRPATKDSPPPFAKASDGKALRLR